MPVNRHPSSQRLMQDQVSRAAVPLAMFDRDMRYLAASEQWHTDFGLERGSLLGRSHYEVFPEIPERWRALHRRGLAGEELGSDQDVFARESGAMHWLRWSIRPWHNDAGEIGGILISSETVSEPPAIESALVSLHDEAEQLFECEAIGIAIAERSGQLSRVNHWLLQFLGRPQAAVVGQPFIDFLVEEDRETLRREMAALGVVRAGRVQQRVRLLHADGRPRWAKLLVSPMPGARVTLFVLDLEERIELEQRLRQSDRLASIGMLGAGIAHDLNNALLPMGVHLNAIEAKLREASQGASPTDPGELAPGSLQRHVSAVRQGIDSLRHLADGMHDLAEDEATGAAAQAEASTSLDEWWRSAEPLLRCALPPQVRFESSLPAGLPRITLAAGMLTLVALNLLANAANAVAARHAASSSQAEIALEVCSERKGRRTSALLRVRDNGVGMSESVRARAGEPFFTTRPAGRGTGLGLAMVRRAVEGVGGDWSISSEPGQGTTVCLRLPVVRA